MQLHEKAYTRVGKSLKQQNMSALFKPKKIMKRIILMLTVIVISLLNTTKSNAAITEDDIRKEFATGMSILVDDLKPYYSEGITYNDFKSSLFGDNVLPKNGGERIISKAFEYLQNNTTSKEIIETNNGDELLYLAKSLTMTKSFDLSFKQTFGENVDDTVFGNDILNDTAARTKLGDWLRKTWKWFVGDVATPVITAVLTSVLTAALSGIFP